MDLQIKGRRAVVTGSTAGIGWGIALRLAQEGAQVLVNGRTSVAVDRALQRIREICPGAKASGFAADLGTAEGCAAIAPQLAEADILVNNLGIYEPGTFAETPDEVLVALLRSERHERCAPLAHRPISGSGSAAAQFVREHLQTHEALDPGQQGNLVDRLGQKVVSARLKPLETVRRLVERRDHHDRQNGRSAVSS